MGALTAMALVICFATPGLASNTVTGMVRNQTRGQPAVGEEVILLRLDGGILEEARTKTDAQGAFAMDLQHPDRPYLVRVVHQNVNYDQEASAGDALSLSVFDASSHVSGVTGTIEILRAGTRGKMLHVSDMYEIRNASSPPVTQASERTLEVYLPAQAKLDSVLAAGPGKIGVTISATPLPHDPGHYSVNFPLQPGATKFAFNYDLPYDGHAAFQTRHVYPVQQLAVLIPPTMRFSSRSPGFQVLATGNSQYQVHAVGQLKAGKGPEFELTGTGALPSISAQALRRAGPQTSVRLNSGVSRPDRPFLLMAAHRSSILGEPLPSAPWRVWAGVIGASLAAVAFLVWQLGIRQTPSAR